MEGAPLVRVRRAADSAGGRVWVVLKVRLRDGSLFVDGAAAARGFAFRATLAVDAALTLEDAADALQLTQLNGAWRVTLAARPAAGLAVVDAEGDEPRARDGAGDDRIASERRARFAPDVLEPGFGDEGLPRAAAEAPQGRRASTPPVNFSLQYNYDDDDDDYSDDDEAADAAHEEDGGAGRDDGAQDDRRACFAPDDLRGEEPHEAAAEAPRDRGSSTPPVKFSLQYNYDDDDDEAAAASDDDDDEAAQGLFSSNPSYRDDGWRLDDQAPLPTRLHDDAYGDWGFTPANAADDADGAAVQSDYADDDADGIVDDDAAAAFDSAEAHWAAARVQSVARGAQARARAGSRAAIEGRRRDAERFEEESDAATVVEAACRGGILRLRAVRARQLRDDADAAARVRNAVAAGHREPAARRRKLESLRWRDAELAATRIQSAHRSIVSHATLAAHRARGLSRAASEPPAPSPGRSSQKEASPDPAVPSKADLVKKWMAERPVQKPAALPPAARAPPPRLAAGRLHAAAAPPAAAAAAARAEGARPSATYDDWSRRKRSEARARADRATAAAAAVDARLALRAARREAQDRERRRKAQMQREALARQKVKGRGKKRGQPAASRGADFIVGPSFIQAATAYPAAAAGPGGVRSSASLPHIAPARQQPESPRPPAATVNSLPGIRPSPPAETAAPWIRRREQAPKKAAVSFAGDGGGAREPRLPGVRGALGRAAEEDSLLRQVQGLCGIASS
ncbi:hypothetical protein M885DRAFT_549675 [Pelagophyceae sp. CCMP2097]|nr:hypothetical protein M885DRAFT_549675 [Pelagophyceae sp. CCMP2097]